MTPGAPVATGRYSRVAIWLHWAIAGCISFNLGLGWFMEGFPGDARRLAVTLHISSGISVLALSILRVLWRVTHRPPPVLPGTTRLEAGGAQIAHLLLYVAMLAMPLTGWMIISAHPPAGSAGAVAEAAAPAQGGGPARRGRSAHYIWGILPLPMLAPVARIGDTPGGLGPQGVVHDEAVEWHRVGGFMLLALLLLHVAGALKHQLIDREAELERMGLRWPRRT